jgi:general secretion pathway protein G
MKQRDLSVLTKVSTLNQKGMTLVEILIVLTIIAAMAAYLVPNLFGQNQKAKVKETNIRISNLGNDLQGYYSDCGKYPAALDGLLAKDDCANWGPVPYAKKGDLNDAWGRPMVYESKGQTFTIISLGRDGQEGGEGFDADISSDNQ